MKSKLLPLLILALILWIILGLFVCKKCWMSAVGLGANTEMSAVESGAAGAAAIAGAANLEEAWSIRDGQSYNYESNAYYRFKNSDFNPLNAESDKLAGIPASMATYLKGNTGRSLNIVGYYLENEKNPSIFGNIGLARANTIKNLLIKSGVASSQLSTSSQVIGADWMSKDMLYKGINFEFAEAKKVDDKIGQIKARIYGKPLILYFQTNSNTLDLSPQQRQDFSDLIYYLDNVPTSSLDIAGHTDNVGNRTANLNLSKNRAAFIKDFLTKNGGIKLERMNTNGYGPDKPLATNNTPEDRAKNRRVEVTLK